MISCCAIGDQVSAVPLTRRVGTWIDGSTGAASGRWSRAWICAAKLSGVERSTIAVSRASTVRFAVAMRPSSAAAHSAASAGHAALLGKLHESAAALDLRFPPRVNAGVEESQSLDPLRGSGARFPRRPVPPSNGPPARSVRVKWRAHARPSHRWNRSRGKRRCGYSPRRPDAAPPSAQMVSSHSRPDSSSRVLGDWGGAAAIGVRSCRWYASPVRFLARRQGVRYRAHDGAYFDLQVLLDGGLAGAAVLLAPKHLHLIADLHIRIDRGEREHRTFVVAVAGKHGKADGFAAHRQLVVVG